MAALVTDEAASAVAPAPAWLLALVHALPESLDDIETNKAPPAPLAVGDLADGLEHLNALLPSAIMVLRAHQGIITGVAHLLAVLDRAGVPHAAAARDVLLAVPGAMAKAEALLPRALWALKTFAPAATGIQGDRQGTGPRIGRG